MPGVESSNLYEYMRNTFYSPGQLIIIFANTMNGLKTMRLFFFLSINTKNY